MPVRLQNYQHLRTNQFGTFTGATSFTWSIRLQVDSMAYSGDAIVLGGQFFGMFTLRFTGVSGSNVVMRAGVTQVGGGLSTSTFQVPMGRPVHLAGVYNGTVLYIYLNATLVAWSDISAALAVSENRPIFLGVDPSFTGFAADYHLDDLYLWRNVALSTAQLRALRDGTAFASDPGPPFLSWSLDGDADDAVLTTSPGVQSAGIAIASVSSPPPVFAARDMAYSPSVRVSSAVVAPSGKGIIIRLEDIISGVQVAPSAIGTAPTLTIDGGSANIAAIGPIWQANVLPYIYYPLAAAVAPDADVRISAAAGWAQAGSRGEVQGMDSLSVSNPGPEILSDIPATTKRMGFGWNIPAPYNFSQVKIFANLMRQGSFGFFTASGTPSYTLDATTRFPVNVTGGELYCRPVIFPGATFDPKGYASLPNGSYTLLWDGTGDARLSDETNDHSFSQTSADLAGPTGKRRTYSLSLGTGLSAVRSPQFRLTFSGAVSNVRIYPPGAATDGSEKFHPGFMRMIEGARCLRFMDTNMTNGSSWARAADLPAPGQFTFDATIPFRQVSSTVVSMGPHDNSDSYFLAQGRCYVLVTTAAPHNLTTGQVVHFTNLSGGSGSGRILLANGTTRAELADSNYKFPCRVMSPTTFAIALFTGISGAPGQPAGTQSFAGQARADLANTMTYEDCIELANLAESDPWICVPHAFTDEATADLAASMAEVLGAGRKLRVEYTNEHWNISNGFFQSEYCVGQGALAGLSASQWYAKRSGEVHAIFAAAFASAGRSADLVRVFGSQSVNPAVTGAIVDHCEANGIAIDEIAIAPYFYPDPATTPSRWAALSADQVHDLSDLSMLRFRGYASAHRATLRVKFPAADVVCYEGGLEMGVPLQGYGANSTAAAALSRAWVRHPRARKAALQYCQNLEDEGCTLLVYYGLAGGFPDYSGLSGGATWFAYNRTDEPSGTGDGTDGKFDNRTALSDLSRTVSVVGKAAGEWIALAAGEGSPAPPRRRRVVPALVRRTSS
jgi:hypothetical protein